MKNAGVRVEEMKLTMASAGVGSFLPQKWHMMMGSELLTGGLMYPV